MVLRSVEQASLPLYVTGISLIFNVVLNYIFIFGFLIIPPMGVRGAALGTTIARGIELLVMLILVYRPQAGMPRRERDLAAPAAASVRELLDFDFHFIKRYFRTAAPVIMNEVAWGGGMTVYKAIYGRVGTEALASINIAETVINLLFIFLMGSCSAAAVMTGKVIGQGDMKKAKMYAYRFLVIGPVIGISVALVLLLISGPVTRFFNVSEYVRQSARAAMILTALWIPFKGLNMHLVIGVLRGGGDTRFALLLDLLGVWAIGIPITFIGGLHMGLAVPLVYFLANSEELFKTVLGIPRLVSGKWINDLTEHDGIFETIDKGI